MIVNWLSDNVPKLSTILCSAGMMVPWLLPNRAVAHDLFRIVEFGVFTGSHDTQTEARNALKEKADKNCYDSLGGAAYGMDVRMSVNKKTGKVSWATGDVDCSVPIRHYHRSDGTVVVEEGEGS